MSLSNAEKQAAHRLRMRSKGFVFVQTWATPAQATAIRAILAGAAFAAPLPAQSHIRSRRKKKISAAESERLQITERNLAILHKYQNEIERMEAERLPRSELCLWLEERGADFGGKATQLNSMLGPRSFR